MSSTFNAEFDRKLPEDCSGNEAYNALLTEIKRAMLLRNMCCHNANYCPCILKTGNSAKLMKNSSLRVAEVFLANIDENWRQLVTAAGACTLQTYPQWQPWEVLVRSVAYQQLHARAGDAILGRLLQQQFPDQSFPQPVQLLDLSDAVFQACGFSASKRTTIRNIAAAAIAGGIPSLQEAHRMESEQLVQQLTTLKGIGRWTVEMFLIYSLERRDIWPVNDFGVREGYRRLKRLPKQLTPKQLYLQGENLRPWRSIAAWYLWRLPDTGLFPGEQSDSGKL